jgi:RimJ/RimL family protein N-acetyltransferase
VKNINLKSRRLLYRRVSAEHISTEYVSWINDPDVNMYLETRGNYTLDLLKSYIDEQHKNDVYFWAIHLKESNKHIGNIKIDPIDMETNSGEYGILMGDKLNWGKGFAKEATIRIIDYCFEELNLTKITLGVIEDNMKAVSLYKNIGFSLNEIRKEVATYNNKLSNALRMSLHVKDFK